MTTFAVVHTLAARGIRLTAEGSNLRAFGPLTDADRNLIRQHKPELVALLTEPAGHCPACGSPSWWRSPSSPDWRCAYCEPRPHGSAEAHESVVVDGGRWRAGTHPPVPEPVTAADVLALHGPLLVAEAGAVDRALLALRADPAGGLHAVLLRALDGDPAAPRPPRPADDRVQAEGGAWRTPDQHDAIRAFDRHHWRCTICMRAGRGYGARCPTGERLHAACRAAVRGEPAP